MRLSKKQKGLLQYAITIKGKYNENDANERLAFLDAIWNKNKELYDTPLTMEDCRKVLLEVLNPVYQPPKSIEIITVKQLLESDLPPINFIVEKIIACGVIVLSAKSKMFKSWLCMQMGLCVSQGIDFLGFKTSKAGVLYIDLENDPRITKERLQKQLNGKAPPDNFYITNDIPTMEQGFTDSIKTFLQEHCEVKLIIIDIFQKIKYQKKSNQNDYDADYSSISELKMIAKQFDICIVFVTHNRKAIDPTDPFANIMGSTALMGATDEAIVIYKDKRSDENATISITGRTVESYDFKATFDKDVCLWKLLGDVEQYEQMQTRKMYNDNPTVQTIKRLVVENGGRWRGRINEIILQSTLLEGVTPICDDARTIGREMHFISKQLADYDNISMRIIKKGSASRIYEYCLK